MLKTQLSVKNISEPRVNKAAKASFMSAKARSTFDKGNYMFKEESFFFIGTFKTQKS